MSRRHALLILALLLIAPAALLIWRAVSPPAEPHAPSTTSPIETRAGNAGMPVDLYFVGRTGRLQAERRVLGSGLDATQQVRTLMEELLRGSSSESLQSPLPATVQLDTVHITPAGVVYLDFQSAEYTRPPIEGSKGELLAVYSLVNSIVLNVPGTRSVVLLWNGQQRPSFAGHVNTTRPLLPNSQLVATQP